MTDYFVVHSRRAAFTLIELLTVITIILILAGLILGIAGHAQNKAATSRAQGEIQAFSTACENYKIDNGTYPRTKANTDALQTTSTSSSAVDPNSTGYKNTSQDLYRFLCGNYIPTFDSSGNATWTKWSSGNSTPKPTTYFAFKDSQLNNTGNVTSGYIDPATVSFIQDPFGFSYGYSTMYQADVDANASSGSTQPPKDGYNPTFDLWSTAGYSTSSGKPYPTTGPGATASNWNTLWVKNW